MRFLHPRVAVMLRHAFAVSALIAAPTAAAPPTVTVGYDPGVGRFAVRGLAPATLAALADPSARGKALVVTTPAGPGLLGTTGVTDGVLWFKPRFPVAPGVAHTATFDPAGLPGGGGRVAMTVTVPRPAAPPPAVAAVYPTADEVPENLLKFYLQFATPMAQGGSAGRVRLLGPGGDPVEFPFLELDEELWDPTGTRLTLVIDPGRVKRGLKPLADVGPALVAGDRYVLEVPAGWPDAAGRPLKAAARKAFRVTPAVRDRVDPAAWQVVAPADPVGSVTVRFPAPLDRALLERSLTVTDAAGAAVPGAGVVAAGELGWAFTPAKPWAAGEYRVAVGADLEDLAGNRADRVFDADAADAATDPPIMFRAFRAGGR